MVHRQGPSKGRIWVALLLLGLPLAGCAESRPVPASPPPASPGPASPLPSTGPVPSGLGSPRVPFTSPAAASETQVQIDRLLDRVRADPDDGAAQRDLGLALLQRIRETGDPSLYEPAAAALEAARQRLPEDPLVLVGVAAMQAGRHAFEDALETVRQVLQSDPTESAALAIETDALIELGRYDEAVESAQRLIDAGENVASLARVSYLRELHGDIPGAIEAMTDAAASPALAAENTAYVTALLGDLLVLDGRPDEARAAYETALAAVPDHPPALAGIGRLAVGRGEFQEAATWFQRASDIIPSPEYVVWLGEAQEADGDLEAAGASFDLARLLLGLAEGGGVDVDLERAYLEADHGDPAAALESARTAYDRRRTIHTADALAWALFRNGEVDAARPYVEEALQLGTRQPLLLFHAGMIEAAGGSESEARSLLEQALAHDPGFSPRGALDARKTLDRLGR